MTAVESLKPYVGQDVLAYDLLLFARMWFADHSQDEIGSTVVLGVFRKYLEYAGGKYAIIFLRSRFTGTDQVVANLAARIIADLLDLQSTPEAKKYRGNYAALRQMAMENGWGDKGPLGAASATPQIFAAIDSIRQVADRLALVIDLGPMGDQWKQQDITPLQNIVGALSVKGPQHAGDKMVFTAENREETEHELLFKNAADSAKWLPEWPTL